MTNFERLLMINQVLILKKLYPEHEDYYSLQEEALREGYELEYPQLPDEKTLNIVECKEIIEIMSMFEDMILLYNSSNEKNGIRENEVTFHGFSCNTEALQCGYARHLSSSGRFSGLKGGVSNLNWQIGKTAATIRFVSEAMAYMVDKPKVSPIQMLERYVEKLKSGKEQLTDWLTVEEYMNSEHVKSMG